jgi:Pentapeptide repeats (8 copies)
MLAHEDDQGVLDACAEAIGKAYDKQTPTEILERLRALFYGNLQGDIGALMRSGQIVVEKHNKGIFDANYDLRIRYFAEAVRKNWYNLESVNLQNAELPNIHVYKADVKWANLEGANLSGKDAGILEPF